MDEIKTDLEFEDFPYICRICLFKGDTKPFTQALGKTYKSLVTEYVEEEVELPRNLCSKCISKLEDIEVFIKLARVGNNHLKEVLLRHKNKVFVEDFDKDTKFEISEEESLIDENDAVFSDDVKDENSDEDTDNQDDESEQIERYQFHCKICKNIFISVQDLNEHKKDCILKCKTCGESFETFKQLDNHYNESEACQVSNELKCDICKKEFRKLSVLKKHAVSHTNDTPYECKLCDKKFKFPQNLRRHDNIVHKGVKPYKCDVCGKDFGQYETLKAHIMSVHGLDVSNVKYQDDNYKTLVASYTGVDKKIVKKKKLVTCDVCLRKFQSVKSLRNHRIIHTGRKDFLCTICGKEFVRKLNLILHLRIHTGEKPYECELCGKQFSQATGYKRHLIIHTGERPYKCEFCNKSFKQTAHLNVHIKAHTNDRPFECTFCGKTFSFKRLWEAHVRIHTGEKPFMCEYCDRRFYDKSTLNKHKKCHLKSETFQIETI